MFRLWAKIFQDNRLLRDTVICDSSQNTRTHKVFRALDEVCMQFDLVFRALDEVCMQFDLGKPIWLDVTIRDFKKHSRARFLQDNFVEQIDFDYLEIQVIEED